MGNNRSIKGAFPRGEERMYLTPLVPKDDDVGLYLLWFYLHVDDDVGTWVASFVTTAVGFASGLVATGSITIPEVIDDCMSSQRTDNSKDEIEPPATHGTRSPTSKSLTK
ncbi:hypothetical protein Tco_1007110 [Tanacetum coccineum]